MTRTRSRTLGGVTSSDSDAMSFRYDIACFSGRGGNQSAPRQFRSCSRTATSSLLKSTISVELRRNSRGTKSAVGRAPLRKPQASSFRPLGLLSLLQIRAARAPARNVRPQFARGPRVYSRNRRGVRPGASLLRFLFRGLNGQISRRPEKSAVSTGGRARPHPCQPRQARMCRVPAERYSRLGCRSVDALSVPLSMGFRAAATLSQIN